jgi:hypothetical protein
VIVAAQDGVVTTMLSPIAFENDSGGTRNFLLLMATAHLPLPLEHQKFELVSKCPENSETSIYDGKELDYSQHKLILFIFRCF